MDLTPDLADMLERVGIATPEQAEALRDEIEEYRARLWKPLQRAPSTE